MSTSELPLKIAILWHQHQPFYKKEHEFLMPWVRMHGVKDYYDLPALLKDFPKIRQTINLAPSLLMQLEEYIAGTTKDAAQRLTEIPASELHISEKEEILKTFFLCNVETMVLPLERYRELYDRSRDRERALHEFTEGHWRDLQTWYNLTWIGELSRQRDDVQNLLKKGRDFTEGEKLHVLKIHTEILEQVLPVMQELFKSGQIELSVTPLYHPILPLLCNSEVAREAMPNVPLPKKTFKNSDDAEHHIERAKEVFKKHFGELPRGVWPSEGSISDEVLKMLSGAGFSWAASDEEILQHSREHYLHTEKYFAHIFKKDSREIAVLFRDHALSDAIGFVYQHWNPEHAADDFVNRLKAIRNDIILHHGEAALKSAVVPIILDGENCWEYYAQNGVPFLKALYERLSGDEFQTITCSEAAKPSGYLKPLEMIRAGSWINANFKIWIGHEEKNRAWEMLAEAREVLGRHRETVRDEVFKKAFEHILIAEGSDWFWWYGDDHRADNQDDFDLLFRWHIQRVYEILAMPVPREVLKPIRTSKSGELVVPQRGEVRPTVNGLIEPEHEWEYAGYYDASHSGSTMHRAGELFKRLWFGRDGELLYFRCDTSRPLEDGEGFEFTVTSPRFVSLKITKKGVFLESEDSSHLFGGKFCMKEILEFVVFRDIFLKEHETELTMQVKVHTNNGVMQYPAYHELHLKM
jgi:alpha-amylase/alpha-mannosidase (GH57 family)